MAGIFISYRRDDTRHAAGRLADDLAAEFGAARIFRDVESIDPGVDFEVALEQALESCAVMLVLIGPAWVDIKDPQGRRRLERPGDWIRTEIVSAIRRGIRLIPVQVEDTPLPDEERLPEDLRPLLRRQALSLSDARWKGDLVRLVETLERMPGLLRRRPGPAPAPAAPPPAAMAPAPAPAPSRAGLWTGIAVGGGALALLVTVFGDGGGGGAGGGGDEPGFDRAPVSQPVAPSPAAAPAATAAPTLQAEPVMAPAPPPAPQLVAVADFSGTWADPSDVRFELRQDGRRVDVTAFGSGVQVASGGGEVDRGVLRLQLRMQFLGAPLADGRCELHADASGQVLQGACQWPFGQEAQLWRRLPR
jgi:hypothetical protein